VNLAADASFNWEGPLPALGSARVAQFGGAEMVGGQTTRTAESRATLNSHHHRHADDRSNRSKQALFCDLTSAALQALETVKYTAIYPAGTTLFGEGQPTQGVFIICRGRVKLTVSSRDGKTLAFHVAGAGEMLGIGDTVCGRPYQARAETVETSEISLIRRGDLLRLIRVHNDFALSIAEQLSKEYNLACQQVRKLLPSRNAAAEKLARVLLESLDKSDDGRLPGHFRLTLTHEEIAEMIGTSRETVTRHLVDFRKRQFIQQNGSTVVVRNRVALESMLVA
jgi:CRP/FNR family cyclic AMP-dependent transcriptional regulator